MSACNYLSNVNGFGYHGNILKINVTIYHNVIYHFANILKINDIFYFTKN